MSADLSPLLRLHWKAGRLRRKPSKQLTIRNSAPGLNDLPFSPQFLSRIPHRDQSRGKLPIRQETVSDHLRISQGGRYQTTPIKWPRSVFRPHQEAILHRVPIDFVRKFLAPLGSNAANMPRDGLGLIDALPAHKLRPPGQVSILAVGKELLVKVFALDRHVLKHRAPVKRSRARGAENVLLSIVLTLVRLLRAPIQVAEIRAKINAGRIDYARELLTCGRIPAQQLSADSSNLLMCITYSDQFFDKRST